jgi:hypothetical protein
MRSNWRPDGGPFCRLCAQSLFHTRQEHNLAVREETSANQV